MKCNLSPSNPIDSPHTSPLVFLSPDGFLAPVGELVFIHVPNASLAMAASAMGNVKVLFSTTHSKFEHEAPDAL